MRVSQAFLALLWPIQRVSRVEGWNMNKARYLYSELSNAIQARLNCLSPDANDSQREWADKHEERILSLVREHMPSGSGFDNDTKIDLDASHAEKLVFHTSFHHMND